VKKYVDGHIILALYVNDMLIIGANMAENFEMKDLGPAKEIFV